MIVSGTDCDLFRGHSLRQSRRRHSDLAIEAVLTISGDSHDIPSALAKYQTLGRSSRNRHNMKVGLRLSNGQPINQPRITSHGTDTVLQQDSIHPVSRSLKLIRRIRRSLIKFMPPRSIVDVKFGHIIQKSNVGKGRLSFVIGADPLNQYRRINRPAQPLRINIKRPDIILLRFKCIPVHVALRIKRARNFTWQSQ